jgi:hypothetical protein
MSKQRKRKRGPTRAKAELASVAEVRELMDHFVAAGMMTAEPCLACSGDGCRRCDQTEVIWRETDLGLMGLPETGGSFEKREQRFRFLLAHLALREAGTTLN